MMNVPLSQVKLGDKLGEDVLTPHGGVLFHKGKIVTSRELDIMQAFLVSAVIVDSPIAAAVKPKGESQPESNQSKQAVSSPLQDEYEKTFVLLKRAFSQFNPGFPFPILDIRTQLEKLLQQLPSYNVLTFAPRSFNEEDYWLHNSVACAMTSYLIAQWVKLPQKDWMQVALAGLLHDIGNIRIDRSILMKPTKLTAEEQEEIQRHPLLGNQLLKNIAALNDGVKLSALQHHERVDGSGYPLGLDSSLIHPYAKVVAIADIFHAMTLNKSYRKGASPYVVLEQIQSDSFGKLEPSYVRIFIEKVTQFHNGTLVRLSDDRVGEIVFSDAMHPTRPWVNINGEIINLSIERQLHITEVVR
ncbi:HD-GYP domain-containing protein [Paenibacillus radicis (ex Gao et al. 2016)]|uniref:HD family phosphohydrolase n=1 Tax=Paenibacillus radicis (ex Gao et al. 2016) TaxID=1737354 RepID=A0A917H9L6_9BACL|nr:HD-GYP domain-containing protein [Paenibacillus radicis (ex Gao et al. 2016)]GGG71236.1 HD family phosphohydrolase [Paenibacillus radicis (ex Gao et al. 2016)]